MVTINNRINSITIQQNVLIHLNLITQLEDSFTFLNQKCAKISSLRPGSIFELSTSRFASHDSPVTTRSRPNIYTSLHDSWFVTAGKKGLQYWSQERITRGKFGEERFQNILSMVLFLCVVNFVFAKFVHRVSLLLTIYWSHYNPPLEI